MAAVPSAPAPEVDSEGQPIAPPRRSLYNKQATGLQATLTLAVYSLGIIYGDIGTSPLYVLNAVFPTDGEVPSAEDVIGAISAIIWSITIVALIKYAVIALEFGNGTGEGGPFAVYTALFPPLEETDENRVLTTYTTKSVGGRYGSLIDKPWVKSLLFTWVLFGTCLTISDGLLTPAVSVTSAVGGIAVASPAVGNSVVPISIAILVLLFAFQPFGTRKVGVVFAPIVGGWLLIIAISGAINIASYPGIFRAFDPSRAILLFVRTKNFDLLSGVLLSITGVEAMFANLGQFSKGSIRVGFIGMVYPALCLAYLGQGARLVIDPVNVLPNVFFQSIPGGTGGGFWWFTFVFAILAAIIASQAMITATFSLTHQLSRLRVCPPIKVIHTADEQEGEVFVPAVNILVLIGTIGLTVGFGTGAGLTNAYGLAVSGVLIVTTSILAIAIVKLKHLPILVAVAFFILFVFVDGLFFGASLKKIPTGAWFPLGLAVILCSIFLFWSWAKGLEDTFDATHRQRLNEVIARPADDLDEKAEPETLALGASTGGTTALDENGHAELKRRPATSHSYSSSLEMKNGNGKLTRIPIFALFHNASANTLNGAPHSFSAFLKCYPSLPQVVVFFNIRVVGIPHTTEDERYIVSRVRSFEGIYIATLRLGYRDPIDLRNVAMPIRNAIVAIERTGGEEPESIQKRIEAIDESMKRAITHILPEFHISVEQGGTGNKVIRWVRTFLIQSIYRRLAVNFVETDDYVFNEEDVLRMSVHAPL